MKSKSVCQDIQIYKIKLIMWLWVVYVMNIYYLYALC